MMQNLKKNRFIVSKMTRIWWILIRAIKNFKNLHFDWSRSCKVYNVWPKKVQRNYLSWHWKVMQSFKKNWLVIWKMTWRIWQIFTRTLESVKIGTLMEFLSLKEKMYELKIYEEVMCGCTGEWCKIWRGIDLLFQNWYEEFDEFWPECSKVLKICILMGTFWPNYIMLELQKYRGVIFHGTEEFDMSNLEIFTRAL